MRMKILQCAHIDINYTDRGCMTCGEKQEMQYHRYLYSLVVVTPSLVSRNLRNHLESTTVHSSESSGILLLGLKCFCLIIINRWLPGYISESYSRGGKGPISKFKGGIDNYTHLYISH